MKLALIQTDNGDEEKVDQLMSSMKMAVCDLINCFLVSLVFGHSLVWQCFQGD